jgi:chromatin structure-remodeling complex subunit RSC9
MLILRNIARNVGKTEAEEVLTKQEQETRDSSELAGDLAVSASSELDAVVGYKERLFRPVMGRLWEVFTENRLLAKDLSQLLQLLGA